MLYLTNTTIMPNEGYYIAKKISNEEAGAIIKNSNEFISALGHEGAVSAFRAIIDIDVKLNRIPISLSDGDVMLALKLLDRLPALKELTIEEMNNIKYEFWLVKYSNTNISLK